MDSFAEALLKYIITGGAGAIISILIAMICFLGYQLWRLDKILTKKDERLDEIVDKHYDANYKVAESLNQLRALIIELLRTR